MRRPVPGEGEDKHGGADEDADIGDLAQDGEPGIVPEQGVERDPVETDRAVEPDQEVVGIVRGQRGLGIGTEGSDRADQRQQRGEFHRIQQLLLPRIVGRPIDQAHRGRRYPEEELVGAAEPDLQAGTPEEDADDERGEADQKPQSAPLADVHRTNHLVRENKDLKVNNLKRLTLI
jgi:hypothetical protein